MTGATRADGDERLPSGCRLRKRSEFLSLQREGRRRITPHFVLLVRERSAEPSRLGITASRKVGNAPQRNRVRRLIREFFRRARRGLSAPFDVLVIAKPNTAKITYDDIVRELSDALRIRTES